MEVSPGKPGREDMFLHLIQVGDLTMTEMAQAELIRENGRIGVNFRYGGNETTVTFVIDGRAAGHIRVISDGETLIDRDLTESVERQAGLAGDQE